MEKLFAMNRLILDGEEVYVRIEEGFRCCNGPCQIPSTKAHFVCLDCMLFTAFKSARDKRWRFHVSKTISLNFSFFILSLFPMTITSNLYYSYYICIIKFLLFSFLPDGDWWLVPPNLLHGLWVDTTTSNYPIPQTTREKMFFSFERVFSSLPEDLYCVPRDHRSQAYP